MQGIALRDLRVAQPRAYERSRHLAASANYATVEMSGAIPCSDPAQELVEGEMECNRHFSYRHSVWENCICGTAQFVVVVAGGSFAFLVRKQEVVQDGKRKGCPWSLYGRRVKTKFK